MKKLSLILVCGWYLLAYLIAIEVMDYMVIKNIWLKVLICHITATFVIYIGSVYHKNSSLYDPFWSIAPIPIILYLLNHSDLNSISNMNKFLITFPIFLWSIRLTFNWIRSWEGFSHEDFRYIDLKKGSLLKSEFINFTGIHLIPTLQVNLSLLPLYFIFKKSNIDLLEINNPLLIFSIFSLLAIIIETVADEQMRSFRKIISNKNITMNKGLWRYSRHPNYFGEVMFWFGIYFMALGSSLTPIWLILSPISMLMLFIFISCPLMDNRSLKKRSDYKIYMAKTSQLLLFPVKKR